MLIFLGKTSVTGPLTLAIAAASFALVAFARLDPTFVIVGSGLLGLLFL